MSATTPRYARTLRGRDELREQIRQALFVRRRVVSLVGPGGVGKTRLAASAVEGEPHVWVPVGRLTDVSDVPAAVATALGISPSDEAEAEVAREVGNRVVVLDEVEQLDVAPLLARWLDACPRAGWLVTTRRALRLDAERIVEVPPLQGRAAVELLEDAAPETADLEAHPDEVAAILRLTGGLPLAIELAAARLALLPVAELRKRLDERYFATLRDPTRPDRALRDVLEESWSALEPAVQRSLAECATFAGPFEVDDAEEVLGAGDAVLDHLHALRAATLVAADEGRLWLLEPVRRFALGKLEQREDRREILDRHAAWAARKATRQAGDLHQPGVLDELAAFAPDLRLVLDRAEAGELGHGNAILCTWALAQETVVRESATRTMALLERALGLVPEGEEDRWIKARLVSLYVQRLAAEGQAGQAVALGERQLAVVEAMPPFEQGHLNKELGCAFHQAGQLDQARVYLERAVEAGRGSNVEYWAQVELALVAHDEGSADEADALLERVRVMARDDPRALIRHAEIASVIAVERRDLERGQEANTHFARLAVELGDVRKQGLSRLYAGELRELAGDLEGARHEIERGRILLVEVDATTLVARADGLLGRLALVSGELDEAAELLPRWSATWTQTGTEAATYAAVLAALRGDVDSAVSEASSAGTALAELAVDAAPLVARPLEDRPGPELLAALREGAGALTDPIEARLAGLMVDTVGARWAGWVIAEDGTWARTPDGTEISLGRSRANAAMLATLAAAHGRGPLGVEELVEAVWPGERLVKKAARTRVYVALSGLRKAGFEELILRGDGGWELDPAQPVFVE